MAAVLSLSPRLFLIRGRHLDCSQAEQGGSPGPATFQGVTIATLTLSFLICRLGP